MNWLIILLGIASNASASVLIKVAMGHSEADGMPAPAWRILFNLHLLTGVGLYGLAFVLYAVALARMPLSVVHPILTVGAVACVALLSFVVFHEPFPPVKVLGVLLVIAGVVLIAGSAT